METASAAPREFAGRYGAKPPADALVAGCCHAVRHRAPDQGAAIGAVLATVVGKGFACTPRG